jgi:hypothetical protein
MIESSAAFNLFPSLKCFQPFDTVYLAYSCSTACASIYTMVRILEQQVANLPSGQFALRDSDVFHSLVFDAASSKLNTSASLSITTTRDHCT